MKSIILRLVLALAAFTVIPNALAADSDGGNFFLDAKFGKSFGGSGYGTSRDFKIVVDFKLAGLVQPAPAAITSAAPAASTH